MARYSKIQLSCFMQQPVGHINHIRSLKLCIKIHQQHFLFYLEHSNFMSVLSSDDFHQYDYLLSLLTDAGPWRLELLFWELLKPHRLWPAPTGPILITAGWAKLMTYTRVFFREYKYTKWAAASQPLFPSQLFSVKPRNNGFCPFFMETLCSFSAAK